MEVCGEPQNEAFFSRKGAASPRPSGLEIKLYRAPYGQAPSRMSAPGPFLKNV